MELNQLRKIEDVDNNLGLDNFGEWWFLDETINWCGPYKSKTTVLKAQSDYVNWLETGESNGTE